MIRNIEGSVNSFFNWYTWTQQKLTEGALARWIGFSPRTMVNIKRGFYAPNKPYTERPAAGRKVSNDDFEVLRDACESIKMTQRKTEVNISKRGDLK